MTNATLPAADVLDAVQPAGKTAGLGASMRERIERTVRGYQRVGEETVTRDQLLRDLRFDGVIAEVAVAVADNIFRDSGVHVYPPYELVDERADVVRIGEVVWTADHDSWTATRWFAESQDHARNSTQLHDAIRSAVRNGKRVVVERNGKAVFERERPLRE